MKSSRRVVFLTRCLSLVRFSFFSKISFSLLCEPLLFWFGLVLLWFLGFVGLKCLIDTHTRTRTTPILIADLFLAHNLLCYNFFARILKIVWMFCWFEVWPLWLSFVLVCNCDRLFLVWVCAYVSILTPVIYIKRLNSFAHI